MSSFYSILPLSDGRAFGRAGFRAGRAFGRAGFRTGGPSDARAFGRAGLRTFELDLLSGSGATLFFACIVDSNLEILFKNFSFRGLVAGTITQIWAVEKT